MEPAVSGLVDEDTPGGQGRARVIHRVQVAVRRERKPRVSSTNERSTGTDGQWDGDLLPGSSTVKRNPRDDILDRPEDPGSHHIIWIHRVYGYGRFRGVVEGPCSGQPKAVVAVTDRIGL